MKKRMKETIIVVTDFRRLNLLLKRKISSIPYSKDWGMICSMEDFSFDTALYLNLGFYHINLDTDAQNL
jgi:hypothetical protein